MNQRLIVLTSESGGEFNVFHSRYFLVESNTLSFKERIFQTEIDSISKEVMIKELVNLGYNVSELNTTILLDDWNEHE